MKSLKKYWAFKNFTNFTISVIGVSGFGLILTSMSTQRKFSSSPIVSETVKIIAFNPSVKDLIGAPITYSGSTSNTYSIQQNQHYYYFQTKASRGAAMVQVSATGQKIKNILKKQKFEQIEQNLKQCHKVIDENKQKLKKANSQQKKLIKLEIEKNTDKIKTLHEEKIETLNAVKENLKKYYIPNQQIYPAVSKCKQPQNILPDDTIIYGIDALSVIMPNKNRINLIPPDQDIHKPIDIVVPQNGLNQITEGYLKQKLNSGLENLTEEQMAAYSKHKTLSMYSKYSNYRFMTFFILACGGIMSMVYYHKYRLQPVTGTLLAHQAQIFFMNNSKIKKVLKQFEKNNRKISWERTISGGIKKDDFECQANVQGIPRAKVYFQGIRNEKNINQYRKFVLEYKQKDEVKKIDLLV